MIKLRPYQLLLAGFCLLFACTSWYFISQNFRVGSFEARSMLTRRPVIIDWGRYNTDEPLVLEKLVSPDSFINFSPSQRLELVNDPDGIPSLFLKNQDEIVLPVFIRTKNSGLVQLVVREISEATSPEFGLAISMWAMSIITFAISLTLIGRTSQLSLPFAVLACLIPQFFYFIYSKYHEAAFAFLLVMGITLLFQIAEKRRFFFLAGMIGGFALYIKLSVVIFIPGFILFYWTRIKNNFLSLLLGFLPFLIFVLATLNTGTLGSELEDRDITKSLSDSFRILKHFFVDIMGPELSSAYTIWDGQKSLESILLSQPLSLVALLLGLGSLGFLALNFISRSNLLRISAFTMIYALMTIAIARGVDSDFYLYAAMGGYFIFVFLIAHLSPSVNRKIGYIIFSVFLISRAMVFSSWHKRYELFRKDFQGCVWVYDCMVKDWTKNNLIGEHPLITLYFLDVGQIEFFSEERIIPIHFASSFTKDPEEDQVFNFFKKFPYREFRILSSDTALGNGRNLGFYLSKEKLHSLGLKIDVLSTHHYPILRKRYQLLRVTRNQNQASEK